MNRKIIILVLLLFSVNLHSQNFSLDGKYRFIVNTGLARIDLKGNNIIYIPYSDYLEDCMDSYKVIHKEGMTFIQMKNKIPKEYTEDYLYNGKNDIITDNKFLILAGKAKKLDDTILLSSSKGFNKSYSCTVTIISEKVQVYKDCSSSLKEKNTEYKVTNLDILAVDTPWVEAAPGDGIGEGFTLVNSWGEVYSTILLMNGYISYEKPYLYKQNNRVKKIKVKGLKSGKEKILDVLDTPHPQTVDISFITEPEDIRVEIADVYKGSKYDDTCLHYCITYDDEVIPYENSIGE